MAGGGGAAVLDVDRSVRGRRWRPRLKDERPALAIAQRHGLPDALARVLAARGVELSGVEGFLAPKIRDLLPDPSRLLDMDSATERIVAAIRKGERIGVFADYDVDGAASAALLVRFLSSLRQTPTVYVPDRLREGYGPTAEALLELADRGVSLVITVDCGTTSFEALDRAAGEGLDVIVVDHHMADGELPRAAAVVNPNRADETGPFGHLCAAGVAFLLIVSVNRALRNGGGHGQGIDEPDLSAWLDLVALATVADMAPLTGVNRALVRQGLRIMDGRRNLGLASLARATRLAGRFEAWHLGFLLGPRINAGGRVGDAGLGVRLLTATDEGEAAALAARLDLHNEERREIERGVAEAAFEQARRQMEDHAPPLLLVASEGWHPGVVGIVASRLKEAFDRPACVVSLEDGTGRGSGRSVRGVALGPAVLAAREAGLLVAGGGHEMAAGFTVRRERLGELRAFLSARIGEQAGTDGLAPEIGVDVVVTPAGVTTDLVDQLDRAGPFGPGNPRPRLALSSVRTVRPRVVGRDHVRCLLQPAEGGGGLNAVAFRSAGTPLGRLLADNAGEALHLAGYADLDTWKGERRAQLVIEDAAVAT